MPPAERSTRFGIKDLAERLHLHPFDVVRILAVHGGLPAELRFDGSELERLAELGDVETWWGDEHEPERDPIRARGILRSLCHELLRRKVVGERSTRVDNLWRGLAGEDQALARRAVNLLLKERLLRSVPTPTGRHVSVPAERADELLAIAEGRAMPAGLAALWLTS